MILLKDMGARWKFKSALIIQIERTTRFTAGTWGSHYKSWQSFKSQGKYLLIKYEDLVNEEGRGTLLKMLKFIYKLNKKNS